VWVIHILRFLFVGGKVGFMKIFRSLYGMVLVGIFLGILLGIFSPDFATQMKFLGDGFIGLLKMMIAPIIFCTVVLGISSSGSMAKVGRVGVKSLLYFESVSNIALILGLVAVNVLKPGKGFNVDPATLDASVVSQYATKSQDITMIDFVLNIIPKTLLDAFTGSGDLLQVLLVAILFGYALTHVGDKGKVVFSFISSMSTILFKMVHTLMYLAPIGAFGAMAFTIGKYGVDSFGPMLKLMGTFYLTCLVFIFVFLGLIAHFAGFNIYKFLRYIKEELLTVLGTSSSETVLVPMMDKLERLGCSKSVVGLVMPTGYSFNLDGTNIYMTIAAVFIAQALNIDLTIGQQLSILIVAVFTSQGASGVTGAGFVTLAATLAVVPSVPIAGMALILGIDRFMSEARAITNMIGNGVATIVVSKWEKELNTETMKRELG
jgi:aerobic C4-dicarboxylate transport protein